MKDGQNGVKKKGSSSRERERTFGIPPVRSPLPGKCKALQSIEHTNGGGEAYLQPIRN